MKKFGFILLIFVIVFGVLSCKYDDETTNNYYYNEPNSNGGNSGQTPGDAQNNPDDENSQTPNLEPNPLTAEKADELFKEKYGNDWRTTQAEIEIPDGVTSVQAGIFVPLNDKGYPDYSQKNTTLKTVKIPDSVTKIDENAFMFCIALESVEIPNSVTSIGNKAFLSCSSLASVEIPGSVTSIGNSAFSECTSLASVNIPNSVTSIDKYAFQYCESLESVIIPENVTYIGDYAFGQCKSLKSITVKAMQPPELCIGYFGSRTPVEKISVPKGSVDAYKDSWKYYENKIEAIEE